MTILHHIDNETPGFDEWTSQVEFGDSTLVRSAVASFPERGAYGLRVTIVGADIVYITKTTTLELDPAGSVYIGTWLNMAALPSPGRTQIIRVLSGGTNLAFVYVYADGRMRVRVYNDVGGSAFSAYTSALVAGRWNYVVLRIFRASTDALGDGGGDIWINGVSEVTFATTDNFDRVSGAIKMYMGVISEPQDGFVIDYDETKIATEYPEPNVPEPATEFPDDPARTVVLYRDASESIEFADYMVDVLNIPRANLIRLPNADGTEGLGNLAEYDAKVGDDLDAYFALNPTVAANCTTFVLGYQTPGYVSDAGTKHSITSHLMRYGQAFSSEFDNPLYSPSTAERLTVSILRANNMYCCTRIDADSLANAKDIVNRGMNIRDDPGDTLRPVPATHHLISDDASLLASLTVQHLRIATAPTPPEKAAFTVADDIAGLGFPSLLGMLAAIIETATNAQTSLRSDISEMTKGLLTTGYACGLGWSALPADGFDAEAFFEMLRIGGSFAEAVAVSVEHLDWTSVAVGLPSMNIEFVTSGHNVYRGTPHVEYGTVLAYLRPGITTPTLTGMGHEASTRYIYAIRPVLNGVETPTQTNILEFVTDASTEWTGSRPAAPIDVVAQQASGGEIIVTWWYDLPTGVTPDDFAIWHDSIPPTGAGAPDATITYTGPGLYRHDFTLIDEQLYYFRIVARFGSIESEPVIVGRIVADAVAPNTATLLTSQTF